MILPEGPVLLPRAWVVFFSSSEERIWRGVKRQALQQWLTRILLERVKAALPAQATSQGVRLEIRLDPTLQPGDFKILPLWDLPSSQVLGLPDARRQS